MVAVNASTAAAADDRPTYRPHDLLTYREAEVEFRVPQRTLKFYKHQGRIRFYKVGRYVHFRWIDLYEFLESLATEPVGKRQRR